MVIHGCMEVTSYGEGNCLGKNRFLEMRVLGQIWKEMIMGRTLLGKL